MASGDSLLLAVATAALIELGTDASLDSRAGLPVLDFDDTVNETARFMFTMPQNYGGGGADVLLYLSMSIATSGDVDIDVEFEDQTGLDLDNDSFGAVTSVDATSVPTTAGEAFIITVAVTNGTNMDNVIAGDAFRIRITRDATNDSASGDMELRMIELQET